MMEQMNYQNQKEQQLPPFIFEKAKHLTSLDAEKLLSKAKTFDQFQLIKLSSVSNYNPLTMLLLYWLLPFFALVNRFFTHQIFSGVIFIVLHIVSFVLLLISMNHKTDLFFNDVSENSEFYHQTMSLYNFSLLLIAFLILWWVIDGFTIMWRTKKGNYRRMKSKLHF